MTRRRDFWGHGSALAIGGVIAMSTLLVADARRMERGAAAPPAVGGSAAASTEAAVLETRATPAAPVLEKEARVEATLVETAAERREEVPAERRRIDGEARERLAAELDRWITRHPDALVDVIADLAEREELPFSPAFLLSIAWSETRGRILAVSPAGAVGLAQATPAAYLSEGFDGRLFVTNSYLIGTRAYITKKPLGDALAIVEPLLKRNTAARRAEAKRLLAEAMELRREGFEELEALRPVANEVFFARIERADRHNLATLRELKRILDRGAPREALRRFHGRVEKDYRYYRNLQRDGWSRYERELTARRNALLRTHFGQEPQRIFLTRPYEAGEYLGNVLDARFSPTHMAEFLAAHLRTKQKQALALGVPEEAIDAWTAALYNGGAVNIRRMQAGLIDRLRETERYMANVPARAARLERAIG